MLSTTRTNWILLSLGFLIIMFFLRAYRWKLLIENTNDSPKIKDVSYSLLLGFFINSFTPKLGEIIRCTSLQKSSRIPASRSFGTVISERIYDLLFLVFGILIIFIIEFKRLRELFSVAFSGIFSRAGENSGRSLLLILSFTFIFVFLYFLFRRFGLSEKISSFFKEIWATTRKTFSIKNYKSFILQTLAIWLLMVLMTYCCLKALPSTEDLNFYFAFIALFIGTIGWAIPSPGGIGTSHFFVLQLFLLFNLNEGTGIAFGILVNGVTVLFTIAGGLIALTTVHTIRLIKNNNKKPA